VRNSSGLHRIFKKHTIDGVIHFAGFKAVGESVVQHLTYFYNNVGSTLFHWQAMGRVGVRRIVFSSSATVYRNPKQVPISENSQLHVTNPYGRTKLIYEGIGRGLQAPQNSNLRNIATLRYFNPIGAHISGTIGEHPKAITNNIIPFIIQVALGKHEILNTFGNYYSTNDGTGVRDSIHVVDLAQGHLAAFDFRKKKIKHNGQLRHWSWS
jgi:UDP-glucose 4-epimerase